MNSTALRQLSRTPVVRQRSHPVEIPVLLMSLAKMSAGIEITIRPATVDDAEAISRHVTALSREFIIPDYSPTGAATLLGHQTPEAIRDVMEGNAAYFVAESQGQLVGAIGFLRQRRHLYHLFVARSHHRQGIGRRLWDAIRAELQPGPVTVNSSRMAIGFYERLGFVSTGPAWEKDGVVAYPMQWPGDAPSDC